MKKVFLITLGLAFAFVGFQSFVNDADQTAEKTVLSSANETWSVSDVEGTDQVLAKDWFVSPCVTPEGIPGTICAYVYPSGNPYCLPPVVKPLCRPNS